MTWKNYEPRNIGKTCVVNSDGAFDVPYQIGVVVTGKQRVYKNYYVRVDLPDGSIVVGENEFNLRAAVCDLDRLLGHSDWTLLAMGVDENWNETGLSQNTTMGYYSDAKEPSNIMALPPPRYRDAENDEFVDRTIKEAVAGMFAQSPTLNATRTN